MANIEILSVQNIFNPTLTPEYDYTILTSKVNKDNVVCTYDSSVWSNRTNITLIRATSGNLSTYENVYGFNMSGAPSGGTSSKNITSPITFRFPDAAMKLADGSIYDFVVKIVSVHVVSESTLNRFAAVVSLGKHETSHNPSVYNTPNFWIQAYLENVSGTEGGVRGCGISATINMYLQSSDGTIVPQYEGEDEDRHVATFMLPFLDIDQKSTIGGYHESIEFNDSTCSKVYTLYDPNNTSPVNDGNTYVSRVSILSYSDRTEGSTNYRKFDNGSNSVTNDLSDYGDLSGLSAILSASGASINWTGSNCGTSLLGEPTGYYTLTLDTNGGTNSASVPYRTFYPQNSQVITPDADPTRIATLTMNKHSESNPISTISIGGSYIDEYYSANPQTVTSAGKLSKHFKFLGWTTIKYTASKTQSDYDSMNPKYSRNTEVTSSITSNITLYAVWTHPKIGSLPIYQSSTDADSSVEKKWIYRNTSPELYRLDETRPWINKNNSAVNPDSYLSKNTTIYANWNYKVIIDAAGGKITRRYLNDDPIYVDNVARYDLDYWWKIQAKDLDHSDTGYSDLDYRTYSGRDGIEKVGSEADYFYLKSDASQTKISDLNVVYSIDNPATLMVKYETIKVTIRFKNGYDEGDTGVVRTLVLDFGTQLQESNIPKPGTDFTNPNPYDHFMGWSIPLQDDEGHYISVYSDMVITAIWGYTPIWIMVEDSSAQYGQKWVKYEPKEEE